MGAWKHQLVHVFSSGQWKHVSYNFLSRHIYINCCRLEFLSERLFNVKKANHMTLAFLYSCTAMSFLVCGQAFGLWQWCLFSEAQLIRSKCCLFLAIMAV